MHKIIKINSCTAAVRMTMIGKQQCQVLPFESSCIRLIFYNTIRKMASKSDHLSRTADNARQKMIVSAEVKQIDNLSDTIKRLHLHIPDDNFSFKAGQWVDMFIPGIKTVGGFSMCSAPDLLVKTRILHLAIKFSDHPPAHWTHTKCQIRDKVQLRVGGDFLYNPKPEASSNDLLLVAGGVGINPLYSMLQHFLFLHPNKNSSGGDTGLSQKQNVSLLYSSRNTQELIFKEELLQIAHSFDKFRLKMFSTQEAVPESTYITEGRIQCTDIKQALTPLDKPRTDVYICGPLPFIEDMKSFCVDSGVKEENVFYEKWW